MIRVFLKAFLIFGINFFSVEGQENLSIDHPENIQEEVFLLSPMRSGTNLLTSSIQLLTKKPIKFFLKNKMSLDNLVAMNRLDLALDYTKKPLYRTHWFDCIGKVDSSKNSLLLIIRNPKELLVRECKADQVLFQKKIESFSSIDFYLKYLEFYENWQGQKLLVYYEDLLLDPEKTLKKVLQFLMEEDSGLEDYIENIETYQKSILTSYSKQHLRAGGSFSKGKDPLFHSKKIENSLLKKYDQKMLIRAGSFWEKYLQRYRTAEEK